LLGVAVPARAAVGLAGLLRHPEEGVRDLALSAVRYLGSAVAGDDFLAALVPLLRGADASVRGAALAGVRSLGPAGARPALLGPLASFLRQPELAWVACEAYRALDPAGLPPGVLARLLDLLRAPDPRRHVSSAVCETLKDLPRVPGDVAERLAA